MEVNYAWRGEISDAEIVALTDSHGGTSSPGWWEQIRPFSLGWVTARLPNGEAVGFVNIAWDGGDHAFLLDTKTRSDRQRQGVATELVRIATDEAARAGCEWLHVDYADDLIPFYEGACAFRPTRAGIIHLRDRDREGDDEVIEDARRRDLGLDLLDGLWSRHDIAEAEALDLAVEAQHAGRRRR